MLIPTSWRDRQRYHSQIHPTPTYRLTETNYPQMSALTELGKLILNKHQSFENIVRPEIEACWETLDTYLQRQHRDTKESYRSDYRTLGEGDGGRFSDQANGLRPLLGVKFDPSLASSLGHYMHESYPHFQTYVSTRRQLVSYGRVPGFETILSFETSNIWQFRNPFRNQVSKPLTLPPPFQGNLIAQAPSANSRPFVLFWSVPSCNVTRL